MTLIDDTKQLVELEAKGNALIATPTGHYELSDLLAVAGKYHDGDAKLLASLIEFFRNRLNPYLESAEKGDVLYLNADPCDKEIIDLIDCLRRMAEAASIMECE